MSLANGNARDTHTGDGALTVFAYTFKVFDEDDLRLTQVDAATAAETTLVLSQDYTVTGVGEDAGGTVVLSPALPLDDILVIERILPMTQGTDFINQGSQLPENTEVALDKLVMRMQQLEELLQTNAPASARVPVLSIGDVAGSGAFDALGNRIENIADPTADQDVASKAYVDANAGSGGTGFSVVQYTSATRPAAGSAWHGKFVEVRDAGLPAEVQYCIQNADDSYEWITFGSGRW